MLKIPTIFLHTRNPANRQKPLLPLFTKIVNFLKPTNFIGLDTMTARFFTIVFAMLLFGSLFSAGVFAQTPAAISYGSLAPAETSTIFYTNTAATPTSGMTYYSPVYVAQNTVPAPITPVPVTPPGLSPSPPSAILPPFDPYATHTQPSGFASIFPIGTNPTVQGQSTPTNVYSGNFDRFVPETYEAMRRFREATSFEYTHLPRGSKENGFGMDEIDIRMQLAFPCRFVPNDGRTGFFYVAPAGSLVWWNGPKEPSMPPNAFGAFLDFGVQPKFNDVFRLNAWGRFGVFSDFVKVTSDALRYQARLEGMFNYSPQLEIQAGVVYLGRSRVKMLPTAGIVWTPDENWVLRLVFPNPKISRKLWTGQQAEWWGYVHMDYGGGSWDIDARSGLTDYNDIRLGVGAEFAAPSRMGGYFEFGGSFERELYSGGQKTSLPSVLYLKTGIIF